jgi:hypothetical protein
LLVGELLADGKEVRPEGFPEMRARRLRHCWLPSGWVSRHRGTPPQPRPGVQGRRPVRDGRPGRCAALASPYQRCKIRALTSGMIGSSSPARIRVGGPQLRATAAGWSSRGWRAAGSSSPGPVPSRVVACSRSGPGPGRCARCPRTARRRCWPRVPVPVAPRREHAEQDARMPGDHQRARPGRHQHQAADPVRAAQRELLRQSAAPGDAQDVGLLIAELVEQAGQQRRQPWPGDRGRPEPASRRCPACRTG